MDGQATNASRNDDATQFEQNVGTIYKKIPRNVGVLLKQVSCAAA